MVISNNYKHVWQYFIINLQPSKFIILQSIWNKPQTVFNETAQLIIYWLITDTEAYNSTTNPLREWKWTTLQS